MSWRWVSKQALVLLHGESLATHGGREGMRDEGLLELALMRPQNIVAYADVGSLPDAATLAASYGVGLAKNHPFVDGNKRAAFLAMGLFLYLNGLRLQATQTDAKHHHARSRRRRYHRRSLRRVAARACRGPVTKI